MQGGLRMLELRCNDLNNKKGEDMTNTGIPYEKFVKEVYTALQLTKNLPNVSSVDIEHNKHIMDNCGIDRQFDLYWERIEFGETKRSVIECKDYQNGVSIDRVDALIGSKFLVCMDMCKIILFTPLRECCFGDQLLHHVHLNLFSVRGIPLQCFHSRSKIYFVDEFCFNVHFVVDLNANVDKKPS